MNVLQTQTPTPNGEVEFHNLGPGDYLLRATFSSNNEISWYYAPIQLKAQDLEIVIVPTIVHVCYSTGTCNLGSVSLYVPQDPGTFLYSWSNGATTRDVSGLAVGDYTVTVTVTTDLGCTRTTTYSIVSRGIDAVTPPLSGRGLANSPLAITPGNAFGDYLRWDGTQWAPFTQVSGNNGNGNGGGGASGNTFPVHTNINLSTANVGIGTASPTAKLHVTADARFDGNVGIGVAQSSNARLLVESAGPGTNILRVRGSQGQGAIFSVRENNNGNGVVTIEDNSGNPSVRFNAGNGSSFINAGNLGVGTDAPAARLHVAGDTRLGGGLTVDGLGDGQSYRMAYTTPTGQVVGGPEIPIGSYVNGVANCQGIATDMWWTVGNTIQQDGNGHACAFIGTVNSQPLVFRSNNLIRMALQPNGNLAVGNSDLLPANDHIHVYNQTPTANGITIESRRPFASVGGLHSAISFTATATDIPNFSTGWGIGMDRTGQNSENFYVGYLAEPQSAITVTPGGNVGIASDPHPLFRLRVHGPASFGGDDNGGIGRVCAGHFVATGSNFATGYVGFNACRNQATGQWILHPDGANNGGGFITTSIWGEMRFMVVPSNTNPTNNQTLDDATMASHTRLRILQDGNLEAHFGIGVDAANQNPGSRDYALRFGGIGSLEAIGSQRTLGPLQHGLDFYTGNSADPRMHITNQGNVYIGVSPADFGGSYSNITTPHRVAVNGNILATGFHARIYSNWPDYVFSEGYELESLDSLASFIRANHHLPGMPSASEVESNGVELAEMNRLLLEHIERLYLHIMELNRKLEQR